MTEQRGVGEAGTMARHRRRVVELAKRTDQELQSLRVHPIDGGVHRRVCNGTQDCVLDAILGGVKKCDREQGTESLGRVVWK